MKKKILIGIITILFFIYIITHINFPNNENSKSNNIPEIGNSYQECLTTNSGESEDYYRCLAQINNDEKICNNINIAKYSSGSIKECKDEVKIIQGLYNRQKDIDLHYKTHNNKKFKRFYKAIVTNNKTLCNDSTCNAILENNVDICDSKSCISDYYEIKGIMNKDKNDCQNIISMGSRITCISFASNNPNQCREIVKTRCTEFFPNSSFY